MAAYRLRVFGIGLAFALCAFLGASASWAAGGTAAAPSAAAPAASTAPAPAPAPATAPATAPAPAPTPAPQAAKPVAKDLSTADEAYELKLREMEERVNQLKEKIYRSKARLLLLQEKILHGVLAGAKVVVTHKNTMGAGYRLESASYYLDGEPIFGRIDVDGSLNKAKELEIFKSAIQPGNHLLSVYMVYRGSSSVFVYVEGVQVKLKSSTTFKAEEGKVTKIDVVGYDAGGVLAKFEDRPAVKFTTQFQDLKEEDLKGAKFELPEEPTTP